MDKYLNSCFHRSFMLHWTRLEETCCRRRDKDETNRWRPFPIRKEKVRHVVNHFIADVVTPLWTSPKISRWNGIFESMKEIFIDTNHSQPSVCGWFCLPQNIVSYMSLIKLLIASFLKKKQTNKQTILQKPNHFHIWPTRLSTEKVLEINLYNRLHSWASGSLVVIGSYITFRSMHLIDFISYCCDWVYWWITLKPEKLTNRFITF